MATIQDVDVRISDVGSGVNPEAIATVTIGPETVKYKLSGTADFNLTPAQVNTLQNAIDRLRTNAVAKVKADFVIP